MEGKKSWGVCDVFSPFMYKGASPYSKVGAMQRRGVKGIWLPKAHKTKAHAFGLVMDFLPCEGGEKSRLVEKGRLRSLDGYKAYLRAFGVNC